MRTLLLAVLHVVSGIVGSLSGRILSRMAQVDST
jgi:hypothetical protein